MIARLWHGKVPADKAKAYHEFLKISGLADYKNTAGNRAVHLLKQDGDDNTAHFYTLTFWDDMEAIKKFAGNEPEKARYYPEDKDFLLEFESEVKHFEILESHSNPKK